MRSAHSRRCRRRRRDVAAQPSVGDLISGLEATSAIVQVKGIESDIAVHRLKARRPTVASSG
jgi:hypothetical protein